MTDIVKNLRAIADAPGHLSDIASLAADEIEWLRRCITKIEDELCRNPPRVGDALFICEAAKAI